MPRTTTFSDPRFLGNDLVQAVPSQVAVVYWNAPQFIPRDPAGRTPAEDADLPLPAGNTFLESPLSGFESSFPPALRTQLHPEGPMHFQGTGSDYCGTTHQQSAPLPQTTDHRPSAFDYSTMPTVPGTVVERPLVTPTRSSPAQIPGPSENGPIEYTEDILQFLGMRGHQYECLWDNGLGRPCGYSGSLVGVKRHLRSSHRLERYAPGCGIVPNHPVTS